MRFESNVGFRYGSTSLMGSAEDPGGGRKGGLMRGTEAGGDPHVDRTGVRVDAVVEDQGGGRAGTSHQGSHPTWAEVKRLHRGCYGNPSWGIKCRQGIEGAYGSRDSQKPVLNRGGSRTRGRRSGQGSGPLWSCRHGPDFVSISSGARRVAPVRATRCGPSRARGSHGHIRPRPGRG